MSDLEGLRRRYLLLTAVRWAPVGLLIPVMILVMTTRGVPLASVGIPIAASSLAALLLELPTGSVADVLGRRISVLAGSILALVGITMFAFVDDLWLMVVAWSLLGAGRALDSGALDAWYVDAFHAAGGADPEDDLGRSGAAGAWALSAAGLVAGIGLALAGGEARSIVTVPVVMAAATQALHTLLVVRYLDEDRAAHGGLRPALTALAAGVGPALRDGLAVARRSPALRSLLVAMALWGGVFTAIETLWQPRLAVLTSRPPDLLFGLTTMLGFGAAGFGAIAAPRLRARLPGDPAHRAGLVSLATGGALVALANAPNVPTFLAAYTAVYLAAGLANPMHKAALHADAPPALRATVLSADGLALQVGGLVTVIAWPRIAVASSITTAWLLAGALAALAYLPYHAASRATRGTNDAGTSHP